MCDTCGCVLSASDHADMHVHAHSPAHEQAPAQDVAGSAGVELMRHLLDRNDEQARHNRGHFDAHGVLAINLMSSPGSGKTALLEATIDALGDRVRIGVIEGDLETENDAARIRAHGVPVVQITTGTACHLDAQLVHRALHDLPLGQLELLFIENVGNLICPACFDLGQHRNVALLSVTEGDDKPSKYPVMFRAADLVVLSKTDLLTVLEDFDPRRAAAAVRALGRDTPLIRAAARRAPDLGAWLDWLEATIQAQRDRRARFVPAAGAARARAALHGER